MPIPIPWSQVSRITQWPDNATPLWQSASNLALRERASNSRLHVRVRPAHVELVATSLGMHVNRHFDMLWGETCPTPDWPSLPSGYGSFARCLWLERIGVGWRTQDSAGHTRPYLYASYTGDQHESSPLRPCPPRRYATRLVARHRRAWPSQYVIESCIGPGPTGFFRLGRELLRACTDWIGAVTPEIRAPYPPCLEISILEGHDPENLYNLSRYTWRLAPYGLNPAHVGTRFVEIITSQPFRYRGQSGWLVNNES